ncbi:hypothetical protein [Aeoliella mucimassa]|uniref:Uncharacterized protein n=1 Tax=Aeoliella mucimassa TaxID=2527972 RepID=A0A518AIK5_9BACT|nr:hypothetical protein [Aeoliella mucimassa]QDU54547.1 hypothetical protein Pan181_07300 [Aeoliella mucimassa]
MDRRDIILLIIGVWVAIASLVRMMRSRRDFLLAKVKEQFDAHRRREAELTNAEKANRRA